VRNISEEDKLLAIEAHPNKEQYPHQRILIVNIQGYIHIVPFVEDKQGIFLKTVFPSRKSSRGNPARVF